MKKLTVLHFKFNSTDTTIVLLCWRTKMVHCHQLNVKEQLHGWRWAYLSWY